MESNKEDKAKNERIAVVRTTLQVSMKQSMAILQFIKGKKIGDAMEELEEVVKMKRAIPMKGEIPHRKGMMSGRYPIKAAGMFIKLLKSLAANASQKEGVENAILGGKANRVSKSMRPGRFRHKFKRVHIELGLDKK